MTATEHTSFSRRRFIEGTGSIVVGFSLAGAVAGEAAAKGADVAQNVWPKPSVTAVDSFLEIKSDNTVVAKFGKGTGAQGLITSIRQLYAEELDVPLSSVSAIVGDSYLTPDQVGASGSNGMSTEWTTVRQAAATARQALLNMAATKLGTTSDKLFVKNGTVFVTGGSGSVTYGQLIGGQKFNLQLSATAPQKAPASMTVVGSSPQREEIPKIVTGNYDYVNDVRLPGMLHARNVKPPVVGATLVSVDGPHDLPGLVKVVAKGNYLAVVCKTEWQAVQAAKALKVTWKAPDKPLFPDGYDAFYQYLATGTPVGTTVNTNIGDAVGAYNAAPTKVSATYMHDFQSHASFSGTCCVADVDMTKQTARIWFGGQKPYGVANPVSDLLGIPVSNIRVTWYPGPGSYGRNDADDGGLEAAYLSSVLHAPVRIQWMRDEVQQWDPKGPAHLTTLQGGLDANGKVVSWNWTSRLVSSGHTPAAASKKGDTLIGNLMGFVTPQGTAAAFDSQSYGFPNVLKTGYAIDWAQGLGTGLRSANFRDPNGPQTTFASEQFIDELAYAAKLDPIDFRLTYLTAQRDINVVKAIRKASNWESRIGPSKDSASSKRVVSGRGMAYQTRSGTVNGWMCVVTVDRHTGDVKITKFVAAQDSGFIVNPVALDGSIKGNIMMSIGRSLRESVDFDATKVKSVDWVSYPITAIKDTPKVLDVVLVNTTGMDTGTFVSPSGAGEPSTRGVAAAIANAIFDATGVRVRRCPMTPAVVLAALKAAGKAL
ncbi:MAG: molybdopterin-dependent oxidoreductase [Actinobacteria bacterium]|uniref:Unannotated protein n=1 Tax=freshwater metagenome TaxID=449393 RepID=A0A6J6PX62_9ZZZZ|nr:molybdopterin-dependent oxidoreductase [Actinomycetota bacterium]